MYPSDSISTIDVDTSSRQDLRPAAPTDPIELQVVRQRLIAIPNLIEKNVERTAFSLLVKEYKDFAIGFVDAEGLLVTQSRFSLPGFVANAIGLAAREALVVFGEDDLKTGDVVLVNGHVIGKHLNDVVALTPVRHEQRLIGFFAVLMHWIDVGGGIVGSCLSPTATDIWQEGFQLPTVKLYEGGRQLADMYRTVLANSRFPKLLAGDMSSQIGGTFLGRDMILEVVQDHGVDVVLQAMRDMRLDAAMAARRAISRIPPGTYRASSFLDDDGLNKGVELPIAVVVTVDENGLTIDLSGLAPQVAGPVNLSYDGGAVSFARIAAKMLLVPDTPVNEGDFDGIHVITPPGTFLSARPGAPMGQGGYNGPTVADTILAALSRAIPERVPAGHHGTFGIHVFMGKDDADEPFLSADAMSGGWGAFVDQDGPSALRSLTHGDVREVPVEIQEALYPYRIDSKRLVADSGGSGRYRGGLGVEKIYTVLRSGLRFNVNIERTRCPPWGLYGGSSGTPPSAEYISADRVIAPLRKDDIAPEANAQIRIVSAGGGGNGPAWERRVDSVLADVADGYVTLEAAARLYGVVVDKRGELDWEATDAARSRLALMKSEAIGEGSISAVDPAPKQGAG